MPDDKKQKTMFLDEGEPPAGTGRAGADQRAANAGAPPPRANQPLSSQSTMMMDAARESPGGARQMVVPTMMKEAPRQQLPPMQRPPRPSTWGRWVAGPIVALLVAAGTAALANAVLPSHKKGGQAALKPQGKLRVNTEPPGASITVDGKRFPRFTPAVIEGDIGATLKLTFTMEGFKTHEADVYVAEGERPFNVHLQPVAAANTPPAPEPVAPPKKEHHHSGKPLKAEPVGEATISIRVRPWAIVFVDKQRLKQTPVLDYKIPSGKHTIELANESKNRREKIEINLKPGEEQEISRDWDK
jgi:hypothetical protein